MKTLIAIPCMDQVAAPFAQSLAMLNKDGECMITMVVNSLIYDSRNKIAAQALQLGVDAVLWLDSDMTFLPDTLQKMTKHLQEGKDVVTGLYFRRRKPFTPVIFSELDLAENGQISFENYLNYPKNSVFEVAACGFGCVMTRTSVLQTMLDARQPWFDPINGMGEDIAFCWRATQLGYKIYCDSTIQCNHVGQLMVNEAFYEMFKGQSNK